MNDLPRTTGSGPMPDHGGVVTLYHTLYYPLRDQLMLPTYGWGSWVNSWADRNRIMNLQFLLRISYETSVCNLRNRPTIRKLPRTS